jgi:dipeptidyl aminopeptidase/acylaminoacyl peptidase
MPVDGGVASQITFGANVLRPRSQIAWSPDGSQMAFVSLRGSQAQVWVASVEGGRLRAVVGSRASPARGQLTWAPGSRIAYQRADHRNIMLVDPATGVERALMGDTASGFLFAPKYAPGGVRLAAIWNRSSQDQGIWIFDLERETSAKLQEPPLWLLGWASGGAIYAQSGKTFYRLSARAPRRAKPLGEVPWPDTDCTPAGPRHPDAFVCAAFDFVSDVWMIENFDSKAP